MDTTTGVREQTDSENRMNGPERRALALHARNGIVPMLVGGRWVTCDERECMEIRDPENGQTVGLVPKATEAQAMQAVDNALRALPSARTMPVHRRADILRCAAAAVESSLETFARLIASEGIKTIREARAEVKRCVCTLRLCAEEARQLTGETIAFDQGIGSEQRSGYYQYQPAGVIFAITPFNDPLNLVAHKVGPAIAAGNTVILKPHEQTPFSALLLARALVEAGLPSGVLQVLTGVGQEIGPAILARKEIRVVSYTGGYETGERIARLAGIKRLEFELGSNCATLVMNDADLDVAAERCVSGAYWAAGQNCLHVQRIVVDRRVYDPFRRRFLARAAGVVCGPKLSESSDMGCLVSEAAAQRIDALMRSGTDEGGRILLGGDRTGTRMSPTVFEGLPDAHPLLVDEIYGPVTALVPCDGMADAIRLANHSPFGLQAGIFTRSLDRARAAIDALDVGAVMINDSTDYRLDSMPFGGIKPSGSGREGVRFSMRAMSETKVVCFNHAHVVQSEQRSER